MRSEEHEVVSDGQLVEQLVWVATRQARALYPKLKQPEHEDLLLAMAKCLLLRAVAALHEVR